MPRLGALVLAGSIVPTTLAGHRFWEENDSAAKKGQLLHFFKNASMLGGLLLAAVDTAGKESLAHKTKRVTKRSKRKAAKSAAKAAAKATKKQTSAAHKVREALPL
jgi:putative oxidoreductase